MKIYAPEGCILNCKFPRLWADAHHRPLLSTAVFGALAKVMPDRVMADGSANIWITQIIGEHDLGRQFAYVFFSSGGTGARSNKDGISATAFTVASVACQPKSSKRLRRCSCASELIQDSGGAGVSWWARAGNYPTHTHTQASRAFADV